MTGLLTAHSALLTEAKLGTVKTLTQQAVGTVGSQVKPILSPDIFSSSVFAKTSYYSFSDYTTVYDGNKLLAHNLTNNGTILFNQTGIINDYCPSLNGSSQYFNSLDIHFDPGNVDFTCGGWFYLANWKTGAGATLFGNWNWQSNARSFAVTMDSTSGVAILGSIDGGAVNNYSAYYDSAGMAAGWHHVVARYTAANKTLRLYIDGSAVATNVLPNVLYTAGSNRNFCIGSFIGVNFFLACRVDEFFFCNGLALSDSEILTLASSTTQIVAGHILAQNSFPSAAYLSTSFYNLTSVSTVNDGNTTLAHNLTNVGTTPFTGTGIQGLANSCAALNGSSQYFSSTDIHFDPGDTDFTCGGWFYSSNWYPTAAQALFGQFNTTSNARSFIVSLDPSYGIRFAGCSDGTATTIVNGMYLSSGLTGWNHIAFKYVASTNTMYLYVNGINVSTCVLSSGNLYSASANRNFAIGNFINGNQFFSGSIDEFFFCNGYAFTDNDIARIYAAKISHNAGAYGMYQSWVLCGTHGGNTRRIDGEVIVSQDYNDLYVDMSSLGSTVNVNGKLSVVG